MKKTLYILCLTLIFSISACVDNGSSNNSVPDSNSTTSSQNPTNLSTLPYEYDIIINNTINAYPWNNDITIVPENPELSDMYRHNSALSEIGFALIDLDNNGQKELIISDINKTITYDLYTIIEGKATHLFASHERNYYIMYENGFIDNGWSGSAVTSGHDFYKLNDGKLDFVERITLDAYRALDIGMIDDLSEANADNCFFRSSSKDEKDYKAVSSDEAIKAIENYQNTNKPLIIEYTLLSEYKQ
ncbi:MAG: hypothetical protein IJE01_01235 [Clostridia bacterium]|nr:hypothetical protein [Clostridia bacterium]